MKKFFPQVPQYILENAAVRKEKVRILCTVPRRIAAISISDRVATERGEKVGYTVGYQIRLESCISPIHTLLT
jgi:HrpA-like RNA helicase